MSRNMREEAIIAEKHKLGAVVMVPVRADRVGELYRRKPDVVQDVGSFQEFLDLLDAAGHEVRFQSCVDTPEGGEGVVIFNYRGAMRLVIVRPATELEIAACEDESED